MIDILGTSIILTILLAMTAQIASPDLGISMYELRMLASIGLVQLWEQMFYWLRLFDRTARYIDLIIDTVRDIGIFSLILLLLLILFATGVYMV